MTELGKDTKAVWIASVPRCGSMWTYNVTRRIVQAAGHEVVPALVPQDELAMLRIGSEGIHEPALDRVRVLKVHSLLPPDLPFARFIVPCRDVGESLLSYMRFTRRDFEAALNFVDDAVAISRHYGDFPRDLVLPIAYGEIVARPAAVARAIAGFLGVEIETRALLEIVRAYSKENVRKLIAKRERDLSRRTRDGHLIAAEEVVIVGPQNVRVFDPATGFQSGHISPEGGGDWSRVLTPRQKEKLEARIAAARRSGGDADGRTKVAMITAAEAGTGRHAGYA